MRWFRVADFDSLDLSEQTLRGHSKTDMRRHYTILGRCINNPFSPVKIRNLNMSKCGLTREYMKLFMEQVKQCDFLSTLEVLDLSRNSILAAGAKLIALDIIDNAPNLKHLNLYSNLMELEGLRYIADSLARNTSITYIDLGKNKIRIKGIKYLFEALASNPDSGLETLGLRNNTVDDRGIQDITTFLTEGHLTI